MTKSIFRRNLTDDRNGTFDRRTQKTIWLMSLLLSSLTALAQTRTSAPFDPLGANLPTQSIGANDLLSVAIYDSPELSRTVRVSPTGYIKLPMLLSPIKVAGKLPVELESLIAAALVNSEILVSPVVTVSVAEYNSRPINVTGAVRNPLTFQAIGNTRLLDAISKAGGLSDNAASEILITTTAIDSMPRSVKHISIKELLNSSKPELNLPLSGGEEISVPIAGRVFVLGNVKRPGAFPLRDASKGTVLQMLSLAEGLTSFSTKEVYIYRLATNGLRSEIAVNLESILKRKSPDVVVLPDDILHIPDNKNRRLGMAAIEKLLLFGSTAGATALIYGNR